MRLVAVWVLVAAAVAVVSPDPASALCAMTRPQELSKRATAVFEGVALPSPEGPDGLLISPATFRVTRYLKGEGPAQISAETALARSADGFVHVSSGIEPRAGERWRIFAREDVEFGAVTSICDGSGVIANAASTNYSPAASYDPPFPWQGVATVFGAVAIGAALGLGIVVARRRLGDQGLFP